MAAPAECGFPAGTTLSYAGRATTSVLGVQEVVGDPMSFKAANIYITRDVVTYGEQRARLVCAIYVDDAGFVELTPLPSGPRTPFPTPQGLPSLDIPDSTAPPEG